MYPHFIEVTRSFEDESWKCLVNIGHIVFVEDHTIMPTNEDENGHSILWVEERYDQLKKLIESSGALINIGDPRIDTKTPLKMSDIKDLIGEPVWNSNSNLWGIVINAFDDDFTIVTSKGQIYFDEEDLKKFPLYRMKSNETNK